MTGMIAREILVADDEPVLRLIAGGMLKRAGFTVVVAADGHEALERLSAPGGPSLALLDWVMPRLDGPEVLRRLRAVPTERPPYIILVTSRSGADDIVAGLDAGANDYLTKPVDEDELVARVRVGVRVLELQEALADRVNKLEEALANVRQLQGLLPMCAYCKSIRDDQNYWQQVETYLSQRSDVTFSHSYCPSCYERHVRPQIEELERETKARRSRR